MDFKRSFIDFVTTFIVTLLVVVIVTYIYSLIAQGVGAIDWERAFSFAITLGIVLTWTRSRET
jgi:hypothetical protein